MLKPLHKLLISGLAIALVVALGAIPFSYKEGYNNGEVAMSNAQNQAILDTVATLNASNAAQRKKDNKRVADAHESRLKAETLYSNLSQQIADNDAKLAKANSNAKVTDNKDKATKYLAACKLDAFDLSVLQHAGKYGSSKQLGTSVGNGVKTGLFKPDNSGVRFTVGTARHLHREFKAVLREPMSYRIANLGGSGQTDWRHPI